MTIPTQAANDTLNITLEVMQSLMKRCIKVKEGDPEAFRLSDDIARRVAKDLKLYGGSATSFSPCLLSFAAIVREHSMGGAFESVPDWTTVTDDDPRIKNHPRFEKTLDYRPPSALDVPAIATSSAIPTVAPTTTAPIIPLLMPSASPPMPSREDLDLVTQSVAKPTGSSRLRAHKRKADDEDADGVVAKKSRKSKSNVDKGPTGVLYVEPKPVTDDKDVPPATDKGCRDAETQAAEWGLDAHIATPRQHSVHHHTRQCDKCTKLNIPCLVLPDKKFGYLRLACANCDSMKITCAIDSVGVRQRLQAAKQSSDPANHPKTSKSRVVSKTLVRRPSHSEQRIVQCKDAEKKFKEVLPAGAQMQSEHGRSPGPTNLLTSEPTARQILQGIQDISRRLDLLAPNERVDALEVKVGSVETNLQKRLDELEQRLDTSDARWKSMASLG
ncbi:uncharacterized protein F5891DRAFT_1194617 [Suillus fuscotomentosus]|uniref:Uncharacterized protein n=1 Tax=Suillus fuscotomentosus TaxID=1912939 RepID=A0AAD4DW55_9AGAM|nr:uncharacterized protein F5891DRAFT_1194617 [Suillus fuscotomentosus]KAG1895102.1 hypothetical protein F5891DRAFT_1194617 [Suillus fuscotomentosus]